MKYLFLCFLLFTASAQASFVDYAENVIFTDGSTFSATFTFETSDYSFSNVNGVITTPNPGDISAGFVDGEWYTYYHTQNYSSDNAGNTFAAADFINLNFAGIYPSFGYFDVYNIFVVNSDGLLYFDSNPDPLYPYNIIRYDNYDNPPYGLSWQASSASLIMPEPGTLFSIFSGFMALIGYQRNRIVVRNA